MAKNYGLGKQLFKRKKYKTKKYKGSKLGMGKIVNKSTLKAGKKNKVGLG